MMPTDKDEIMDLLEGQPDGAFVISQRHVFRRTRNGEWQRLQKAESWTTVLSTEGLGRRLWLGQGGSWTVH